jgi:hypothetical protein
MEAQTNTTMENQNHIPLLTLEDKLDIDMSPVDKDVARAEIEACNARLAINGKNINHEIAEVSIGAIGMLYKDAMLLRQNESNFVTGIKMNLIILNGVVSLVYQPVLMTRQPSVIGEPFYNVAEGAFYTYNTSLQAFELFPTRNINVLTENYRNDIQIKHRVDTTFTSFIPNVDTESIIFPFQTIYALAKDNMSPSIFIHNSIRLEPVGGGYSVKHCLLLSAESLEGNSFKGKYANRSHLCPPSCNLVQYALLRI